jgi:hypothetical protein
MVNMWLDELGQNQRGWRVTTDRDRLRLALQVERDPAEYDKLYTRWLELQRQESEAPNDAT